MYELPDLDTADARPLHVRISAVLRRAIEMGWLAPGERVPGENVLIKRYGISRWVAQEALTSLARDGLITKVPKVGTFVREGQRLERKPRRYRRKKSLGEFATEAISAGRDPNIEASSEAATASPEVAERLGINVGDRVMRTDYRFLADGQPIQTSVSYEPLDLTEGTEVERPEEGRLAGTGVITRMDSIGEEITEVTEEVTIRPPTTGEIEALNIPTGVHVFCIRRTFTTERRPVETADIVIPGDRYALVYQFRVTEEDVPATV